jgi:hypothetical protein
VDKEDLKPSIISIHIKKEPSLGGFFVKLPLMGNKKIVGISKQKMGLEAQE